jgi:hypothetical protein
MTKGDFCLPPKVLARALIALILVELVLFMWGWFSPAMPMTRELVLAALVLLAPAYFVKVFLQYGGEEGTLWTRVAGCVSSAMIALGSLGLAWGGGNGLPNYHSVGVIGPLGFYTFWIVIGSFVGTLEDILKDNRVRDR